MDNQTKSDLLHKLPYGLYVLTSQDGDGRRHGGVRAVARQRDHCAARGRDREHLVQDVARLHVAQTLEGMGYPDLASEFGVGVGRRGAPAAKTAAKSSPSSSVSWEKTNRSTIRPKASSKRSR